MASYTAILPQLEPTRPREGLGFKAERGGRGGSVWSPTAWIYGRVGGYLESEISTKRVCIPRSAEKCWVTSGNKDGFIAADEGSVVL